VLQHTCLHLEVLTTSFSIVYSPHVPRYRQQVQLPSPLDGHKVLLVPGTDAMLTLRLLCKRKDVIEPP
jgi:hypothetical protein